MESLQNEGKGLGGTAIVFIALAVIFFCFANGLLIFKILRSKAKLDKEVRKTHDLLEEENKE